MSEISRNSANPFEDEHEKSLENTKLSFWNPLYRQLFNNSFVKREIVKDLVIQASGVDSVVHLKNNITIKFEEKLRDEMWSDICLEYISNDNTNAPGWIEKQQASKYLVYIVQDSQNYYCYVYSFAALQDAWMDHKNYFIKNYGYKYDGKTLWNTQNKTYKTIWCPVPFTEEFLPEPIRFKKIKK